MNLSVKIRKANISDAPAIAKLSGQLGYPATTSQISIRLAHILNQKDHAVLVAETDVDGVIGWIHVSSVPRIETDPFVEVCGLVVDEAQRCQGIGKKMINAAHQWVKDNGFHILRVRSNIIRSRAHTFYQREGFHIAKSQVVFEIISHPTENEHTG